MKSRYLLYTIGALLLTIAALPAPGLFKTLMAAHQAQSYVPVSAKLIEGGYRHQSIVRGGEIYLPFATYRYQYQGQVYQGDKVSITHGQDNLGDYQQEIGKHLAEAFKLGEPVTVYVDPDDPETSVYDRNLRWGLLALRFAIVVLFGGLGLLFVTGGYRLSRSGG